ncbi:MAG: Ger(x)C family spore germination C-terminal domain-containing protein [bacterium]|nr:Ger(x)C family spore germination C-terminal domain-containing protein [bacterium]
MKLIKYLIPLCAAFVLSGCFGSEPNDVAYVSALGIDTGLQGNYDITIQFARPTQISGGSSEEGGKGGEEIVENIQVEAPDIYSAVNIANHLISKRFSLSHMKLIVFSREAAQNGIKDVMETVSRSNEMRPDIITAVSRETANSYLENLKPIVEVNPAKYYQLIFEKNNSGGVPKMNGISSMNYLVSNQRDIVMPLTGVAKANGDGQSSQGQEGSEESQSGGSSGKSQSEGSSGGSQGGESSGSAQEEESTPGKSIEGDVPITDKGFQYKNRNYKAGEIKLINEDKSEALGMAVFKGDKLIAAMSENEANLYNILIGDYKDNYTSFFSPVTPEKAVTIKLSQRRKPVYKIDKNNKKVKISIYLEGEFYSLPYDYEIEDEVEEFEKSCAKEISKRCREFIISMRDEYNADILGFGERAKGCFWDMNEYNEYNWQEKFKEYDIEVTTMFRIRHSGITYRERKN